jgi:hypothetical protein
VAVELNATRLPSSGLGQAFSRSHDNLAAGGYRKNSPSLYTTFPSVRM